MKKLNQGIQDLVDEGSIGKEYFVVYKGSVKKAFLTGKKIGFYREEGDHVSFVFRIEKLIINLIQYPLQYEESQDFFENEEDAKGVLERYTQAKELTMARNKEAQLENAKKLVEKLEKELTKD